MFSLSYHAYPPFNPPSSLKKKNKKIKNSYTRKQPTHFSMTPLRPKFKKEFFKTPPITQFGMPKKNDA